MKPVTKDHILFPEYRGRLLEQITYNPSNDSLLWVDIIAGEVHRVIANDWSTHEFLKWKGKDSAGCVLLTQDDDEVIVCGKYGLAKGNFKKGSLEYFKKFDFDNGERLRSNDGYVDPWGNIWLGIMNDFQYDVKPEGKLIRIKPDLSWEVMVDESNISNGTTFSTDHKRFYWTDSLNHKVWIFDYVNDNITNKRQFVDTRALTNTNGEPDGLTITDKNEIYQAFWGQSKVLKYSSDGKLLDEFVLPAERISSVTIGGKDNNILFVTTAHKLLDDENVVITTDKLGDLGGYIYAFTIKDHGVPKNKWVAQ